MRPRRQTSSHACATATRRSSAAWCTSWRSVAALGMLAHEEDLDVIWISSLATDHLFVPKLMEALRAAGLGDVAVIVGGIVPDADEAGLLQTGAARGFHPAGA